ncbi:N-acyl-D-amino-acid deacylase [Streptoalloteichus tenebrarius]|uniref:N-acyl-D-amino-acid deacylase n=1 Tax=Streptoalloteichus tenebrarius (strain ATCC 17920 / DSM 40477 / JCM 4838 / CBS 697.72 / NBRC 16177 / NCIMB 11028 / NRRL B-12390 / A12253. 1 / ISP 5477) TaxID=1933 RepID=A0ABT1HSF9_STRSD|nr:D-aminoacylase [Streptoalloteichus tenebrarius]MCP2258465.1 N-acyl-D-amino-acid deacylase [Streptoalloteichus tenebrarius]BFF03637.1 D-aminoacylase [Streptoalloteichus tenebrarius]
MDIVFRDATVVDGTGAPAVRADVGVADGRIAAVDRDRRLGGRRVVDADGLVLAPGFIDMHSHSDLQLLANPDHLAKVSQGVTLEVLGQDGLSYAPVDDDVLAQLRAQLAGWNDDPPGFDWDWRTVGEYLDRLDRGVAVNAAYLVPQGTLRMMCLGWEARPATADELDAMRRLLAEGLAQGAVGMSSGLTYTPGMYADTDELVALCEVVAAHGGFYSPHHRSYGAGALDAYAEMIEVSRRSGCPLHLAHATMNFPVNAGRAGELLSLVDSALAEGCDITLDTYPYLPGATYLSALLPSWVTEGGVEAALVRLTDAATRERVRHELEEVGSDGCHGVPVDWETIEINGVRRAEHGHLVGLSVAEAARRAGRPPAELYFDVLVAERLGTSCLMHVGHEDNVRAIMRHPAHTVGSDGLLVGERPHPRAWGTFPRYLGRYVRELGVLSLEECVAHMTGRPARRLRLRDRGLVRVGHAADLVLFDPDTITDTATFDEPRRPAVGVRHVLVNGVPVVDDGRPTGALPGRSIRRG